MLKALDFKVTIASTHCFLVRYLKAAHADRRMVWLACYITERVLQEYHMLKYLPSTIASSAVYLARKNLQRSPWVRGGEEGVCVCVWGGGRSVQLLCFTSPPPHQSPTLHKYTQYTESSLRACLQEMSTILSAKSSLQVGGGEGAEGGGEVPVPRPSTHLPLPSALRRP